MRKVYVASSWRNKYQQEVVKILRWAGHEVYDYRNPAPGEKGFSWSQIDPNWQQWTPAQFREALQHPVARHGYKRDKDAVDWCDAGLLVLPSGMSAHLEAGWIGGSGKPLAIYMPELKEPELMYNFFDRQPPTICLTIQEVLGWMNGKAGMVLPDPLPWELNPETWYEEWERGKG